MKVKFVYFYVLFVFAAIGCSTDNDEGATSEPQIVGTWNLTSVNFTGQDETELNLAAEIIDRLAEEACYLVTFEFNANGNATATDRINFIEVNAGPTGLEVPCPTNSDVETTTWSLSGNQLTFINEDLEEETILVEIDGNTMILNGEDLNADNYAGAQAIFTRA